MLKMKRLKMRIEIKPLSVENENDWSADSQTVELNVLCKSITVAFCLVWGFFIVLLIDKRAWFLKEIVTQGLNVRLTEGAKWHKIGVNPIFRLHV